ncbi:MAG TPA: helix-turn-helix transcriptional regulator [Aliiroseovarius sp.]|nr:helix-turn-helix transcriptional regulator [Aliiroseovarius sp.]
MLKHPGLVWFLVLVQTLCGAYFIWDILASALGLPTLPLRWEWREIVEIGAAVGLILGAVLGVMLALAARAEMRRASASLRKTSGQFSAELAAYFDQLALSPAESEIAWFLVKGMSPGEIAEMRGTRESTIRAQCTAIYRKAGVNGKTRFVTQIFEDLLM